MKKSVTLFLLFLCCLLGWSQQPSRRQFVASPSQLSARLTDARSNQIFLSQVAEDGPRAHPVFSQGNPPINGKLSAVSPVAVGSSSNVFTIIRTQQNQVAASDTLNSVVFIHRNNTSVYGGSKGNLRYDISLDGGISFFNDVGPLNPVLTYQASYPNIAYYYQHGVTSPTDAMVVELAPITASGAGQFDGVDSIVTAGLPPGTENYTFQDSIYLPSSLCQSAFNEFWAIGIDFDGVNPLGPLNVVYVVYTGPTGTYIRCIKIFPWYDLSFDGTVHLIYPEIAYSPDGSVGWIAMLSNLVGGPDSLYSPVFMKTTDQGMTWSTPVEVNLNSIPWVADSLQTLWVDSLGAPVSDGVATTAFDFDLTVDADGNPHMAVVVGTHNGAYGFNPDLAKFLADVHSTDGGLTWDVGYVSPILTFRTPIFGSSSPTVYMDNYPQISRSEDGEYIFYSWADSDTALVTGNQNGIGFGISDNNAPNLRISGLEVASGGRTYPQLVTDGDLIWDGRALFPTMAPTVLHDGSCWKLPIVLADMPASEPLDPTIFYYFGNDAIICNGTFCNPGSMALGWSSWAFTGAQPPCTPPNDIANPQNYLLNLGDAFPNPTEDQSLIPFQLSKPAHIVMELLNVLGQPVVHIADGMFTSGAHHVEVNTADLPSGIYFYTLRAGQELRCKRLVVSH